jgi:hypothetical protein
LDTDPFTQNCGILKNKEKIEASTFYLKKNTPGERGIEILGEREPGRLIAQAPGMLNITVATEYT